MRTEQLLDLHSKLCHEARELMKGKNHDYAGKDGDEPFANFTRVEAFRIGVSAEKGVFVRMLDKMSRLATYLTAGKLLSKNEGFKDALIDNINYSILLYAMLSEKPTAVDEDGPVPVNASLTKSGYLVGCVCGNCVLARRKAGVNSTP